MGYTSMGRWIGVGLALVLLSGCDPDPPPPGPAPKAAAPVPSDDREALYDYCDRATGPDPKCWSTQYHNNLRALEHSMKSPDSFGGQSRLEVDGPQGLAAAAPVGTRIEFVSSTLVGIDFVTDEPNSAAPCRTAFDEKAQLGVVTVLTDTPLGPQEIVQAYIIANPVFRMGNSLSEAAVGLGAPGIGVMTSLADLQSVYPDLEIAQRDGMKVASTPPEEAREDLGATSTERQMVFVLDEKDRVTVWMVGVPKYAANLCN